MLQAMDDVEALVKQAGLILDQAEERAAKATQIPNLPGYMQDRLGGLKYDIRGAKDRMKQGIRMVRQDVPKEAAEKERGKGQQVSMEGR